MNKASLRKEFFQKRMSLTQVEVDEKTRLITKSTLEFLQNKVFKTVHVFLPQRSKSEVNTWKVISALQSSFPHVKIAAPYIIPGTRKMEHYLLTPETSLIENRWGIPEPDPLTATTIESEEIDVVLIPLLAFDKSGFRVGYGGGFYDRFLVQCRNDVPKIGLSFFAPIDSITDVDEFDIRLDFCVTPTNLYHW